MPTTLKTIPEGWEKVNLGVACNFERGIEPGADAYNSDGIGERFLRVVDVTESRNDPVYVDIRTAKKLKENDIALTLDGTIGAVRMGLTGIYSTGVRKVSFKNGVNSNRLLYYILQSNDIQRIIDIYASGSTIKHASSAIPHLFTLIPSSPNEQKKITEILSTIDGAIEKTDALIEKYKRMKTGVMQDLFRYGIDDKGKIRSEKTHKFKNSPLGRIPAEWDIVELGKIANVQRGKFQHRPRNEPRFYGGSIPFVQTGDVANANRNLNSFSQTLNEKGLRVSRLFPKGTIIITIAANIGDIAIASFDVAFPDSLVGIRASNLIDRDFLYYYLCTRKPDLNSIATESAQKNINLGVLNPYQIIYPTKDEQKIISEILTRIDENIDNEETNRDKLMSIKAGLMEDLLTGIVRVNHLVK